ncbi:pro-MCH [Cyprinodon tularosa]|uniref:pro-MCH n=1 Tax=Cyprinodon tularosa TaxID=77115 RepID=UPI0018E26DD0|nr:pro-MCH [Cyprinodon tularosa]
MSVYSLLFAIMLFSEMNSHFITVAMPAAAAEEQEGLGSILAEEDMTERAAVPQTYRRSLPNDGTSRIIVIPDMKMKGHSIRGLNLELTQSHPLITERSLDNALDEFTFKINKREKDLDMLRCMIGRVYRPCWEV